MKTIEKLVAVNNLRILQDRERSNKNGKFVSFLLEYISIMFPRNKVTI